MNPFYRSASLARRWLATSTAIALLAMGFLSMTSAQAQTFPDRAIRIIDPYSPGGATDLIARLIAPKLATLLGKPVVIENRPGASGTIAANEVARATDGHTFLMGVASTIAVIPHLRDNLPYDTEKDLVAVAQVATFPSVLVVPNSSPITKLDDLIDRARRAPGKLNYASGGIATANHLSAELFKNMTGLNIIHVPYKGGGPAVTAVIAGEVDLLFATLPAAVGQIKSNALRAIGVTGPNRSPSLPDLPTIAESGLPNFSVVTWTGLLAPSSMSKDAIEKMNKAVNQVLQDPEVRNSLAARATEVAPVSVEEFTEIIRNDSRRWAKLIKEAGIKAE